MGNKEGIKEIRKIRVNYTRCTHTLYTSGDTLKGNISFVLQVVLLRYVMYRLLGSEAGYGFKATLVVFVP